MRNKKMLTATRFQARQKEAAPLKYPREQKDI